jgi:hypothetical protein
LLNNGTAFSEDERTALALHGLLPPHVAPFADTALDNLIAQKMWEPVYRPYCRKVS